MITALPAITVSAIYLAYSATRRDRHRRARLLRERVTYMLWVAATGGETGPDDDEPAAQDLERRLTTYTFLHRRH